MCCGQKRAIIKGSPNLRTRSDNSTSPGSRSGNLPVAAAPSSHREISATPSNTAGQQAGRLVVAPAGGYRSVTTLRYLRSAPARIIGAVTGRQYNFSASHPVQVIDSRDASGLLSTGLFRRG